MNSKPLIEVDNLRKIYTPGIFKNQIIFQLKANFTIEKPSIIGVMGPNGAGKTTLFELIAGKNIPTTGKVMCLGKNIHKIKYNERKYLALHHYKPSQFRRYRKVFPNFLLKPAGYSDQIIHLFDEFDTEEGYTGLILNHYRNLREMGHLVFFCMHPTKPSHLEMMRKICEQYIFIHNGILTQISDFEILIKDERVGAYLRGMEEEES
jgi:ABC-type Na+ transport system ATPase subunit NatA